MKDKEVNKQSKNKKSDEKRFDHESFRRQLVQLHKPDINKKHIEKAAGEIEKKFTPHFTSAVKGRAAKQMPEENTTLKVIKEFNGFSELRKKRETHRIKDRIASHSLSVRQGRLAPIKTGMTHREEVEMQEALRSDIIKKASKDAAARSADPTTKPGATPSWLKQAIKDRASKKVQKEEVELEEKQNVFKTAHTWGTTTKVYHNDDHSSHYYILHPEHVAAVKKLNDGEHTKFTDETGNHVTAHRKGDTIHFTGSKLRTGSAVTTADRKHFMEEVDLEEAKRGRPRKDGSKPAGDDDHQEADKNIHTQLHKVISANKPVTFNNGKTHQISAAHAHKALHMLQNAKASDRLAIQHSLAHSHDRFHDTLKSGKAIVDAPRPKVSLAKSVREDRAADVKPQKASIRMINGVPTLVKYTPERSNIKVEAVETEEDKEEKKEGQTAPKGAVADMTADSKKKIEKDPLASKEKLKLPPTVGNKSAGGEDTVYGSGKYSVAEEKTLNSLYEDLSEENKEFFNNLVQTDEGIEKLLKFAKEQGY